MEVVDSHFFLSNSTDELFRTLNRVILFKNAMNIKNKISPPTNASQLSNQLAFFQFNPLFNIHKIFCYFYSNKCSSIQKKICNNLDDQHYTDKSLWI